MSKQNKDGFKNKGNIYDKIFKENAESIFLPLVEMQLGIQIKSFIIHKEKYQKTLEREMDFFYEVETQRGETFLLHLEFQTEPEEDMLYRIGEYHNFMLRRRKMPIRHLVIFLGKGAPNMETQVPASQIYKGFEIVQVYNLDTQTLLSSQIPEFVLLAILSNYPKRDAEAILRLIVRRLREVSSSKSSLSKYLIQLTILARLRKLEELSIKITTEMPITYDIESDYLYKLGMQKAREKELVERKKLIEQAKREREKLEEQAKREREQAIEKLLEIGMKPQQITQVLNVSLYLVRKVKKRMDPNSSK